MPASFELFQPAELYVPFGPWAATPARGSRLASRHLSDRAAEGRRHDRAGARRARHHRPPARGAVSGFEQERPRADQPRAGSTRAERPAGAVDAAGRRDAGAADRVRERGQPAAGPRGRPAEGNGRAAGDRRRPRADHPAAGDRKPGAGLRRRAAAACCWRCGCVSFLSATAVAGLPRAHGIAVDWPVAMFTLALSVVTGLVFGAVPAWQATRFDIRESLNEESRGGIEQRPPSPHAVDAGGRGDCAGAGAARRRRIAAAQLFAR